LPEGLPALKQAATQVGLNLQGAAVDLDAGFDATYHRQCIFKADLFPNITENPRHRKTTKRAWQRLCNAAVRWGVELTIKALKGGLHVGRVQVSQDADRGERSVLLPVCAYLLWVRLYGTEEQIGQNRSLFQLKQRFAEAFMQDQVHRVE
jgi:hypothetical protein